MKNTFKFYWLICLISLSFIKVNAQVCGTPTPNKLIKISDERIKEVNAASDYPYVLRIFVHILRNDDGSNAATTSTQLNNDLVLMGSFFRPHNICFAFVGFDYFDNTTLNTAMNFSNSTHVSTLLGFNRHTDAIDIYVHNGSTASGGYTYDIPYTAFSVVQSANFNFYHEMGHALGLYHTFETFRGTSCPDNSNCSTSGDFICDTPADFSGSENSNSGCNYIGTQSIVCNGATRTYSPPMTNIMSYWYFCYSQFTPNQATRMRSFVSLATNQGGIFQNHLINYDESIGGFLGTNVNYNGEFRRASKNEILIGNLSYPFNGNVIFNGNHNSVINAGNKIVLKSGTSVSPTSGKVTFKLNNICN
jgi:Pregnancy-associated plasma protein-A